FGDRVVARNHVFRRGGSACEQGQDRMAVDWAHVDAEPLGLLDEAFVPAHGANAVCSTLARSGGISGGAANGSAMKDGSAANSISASAPGSSVSSRPIGISGNSRCRRARPKAMSGRNAPFVQRAR